jgi:murein L,D-transpeptidase YcbB/YkuD
LRFLSNLLFLLVIASAITGCKDKIVNPNKDLTLKDYESLDTSLYALNSHRIREDISMMIKADKDSMQADFKAKSHYLIDGSFLWIDRHGLKSQVDSLVSYLQSVKDMGFSPARFRVAKIKADLKRARELDFDTAENSINHVMARLEYNLTKAYLRYVTGQRFGYMNPSYVFNRLDAMDGDSVHVRYRGLFAVSMDKPGKRFYSEAFRKISNDSVPQYLREIQPHSKLYYELLNKLNEACSESDRIKILCNMERCRWRQDDYPQKHKKYVVVNVPSYHLMAVDGDSVLEMRVGCGTFATKTPLLTSEIMRMDINPQWIIPHSIIKNSLLNQVGNRGYWSRHHYYVREKGTGKVVPFEHITRDMLASGKYYVIQQGGIGNSLGRIIFRFKNSFSVFLHDTSQPGVFNRDDRGVSHGCVRVEKPFELACFMLGEKDEKLIEKIRYSMTAPLGGEDTTIPREERDKEGRENIERSKMIGSVNVNPKVPLFITYYTMFPDKNGVIREYADVYGYDGAIYNVLKNYL